MAGLVIGAILPFFFTSFLMNAVGIAAEKMVFEIRRAVPGDPRNPRGHREATLRHAAWTSSPGRRSSSSRYRRSSRWSLRWRSGFLFGPVALAGLLLGTIISGFPLALMMTTGGAAWDNGKKYIESGNFGGKHSDAHKAAIVGRHGRRRDQGHRRPGDQPAHQGREHDLHPVHRPDRRPLGHPGLTRNPDRFLPNPFEPPGLPEGEVPAMCDTCGCKTKKKP